MSRCGVRTISFNCIVDKCIDRLLLSLPASLLRGMQQHKHIDRKLVHIYSGRPCGSCISPHRIHCVEDGELPTTALDCMGEPISRIWPIQHSHCRKQPCIIHWIPDIPGPWAWNSHDLHFLPHTCTSSSISQRKCDCSFHVLALLRSGKHPFDHVSREIF